MLKFATQWETELLPYGLAKTDTAKLQQAATTFGSLMTVTRDIQLAKKSSSKLIKQGFERTVAALVSMDALVDTKRTKEPGFHADYWNRRNTINLPARVISLRGIVTDVDGKPLKNVKVTIDGMSRSAKSTATGSFQFRRLTDGVYILRASRPGYEDILHTAAVSNGVKSDERILLRPAI